MEKMISLESEAADICKSSAAKPLIYELPPEEGRVALEEIQDSSVKKFPANIDSLNVDTGRWGNVKVYVILPDKLDIKANIIYYIHGGGWVFGSFHTHEKLIRELAYRTKTIIIFPEYSLSPEAKYPAALEQCYLIMGILDKIVNEVKIQMNRDTLTLAGDNVGGNMAIGLALMSKYRNGPSIQKLLLYYPVTDASLNTESCRQFAKGYYLYQEEMERYWDQYTESEKDRNQINVSPLRAEKEQLSNLPDTMILTGEADVLRDDGEAFAIKLREAGVNVTSIRYQAIIHDFVMLNSLDQTKACRAAMDSSTDWINQQNKRIIHEKND
ncbi:MAG: alpha/beta hydrolase [Lachnoclostridium sp.]|jgi:acetyl esterase/lipase|nr:alpha/beta hydrolase [Lachnoclostridium sp.]